MVPPRMAMMRPHTAVAILIATAVLVRPIGGRPAAVRVPVLRADDAAQDDDEGTLVDGSRGTPSNSSAGFDVNNLDLNGQFAIHVLKVVHTQKHECAIGMHAWPL